jgi:hypothetical protein
MTILAYFTYTLEPPLLDLQHPYDDFLFKTKLGFCEHFAGSFTLLMRAAGLPARVVTGYQGGEVNPLNKELIVRQADAHAWSEVWNPGRGLGAHRSHGGGFARARRRRRECRARSHRRDPSLIAADRFGCSPRRATPGK